MQPSNVLYRIGGGNICGFHIQCVKSSGQYPLGYSVAREDRTPSFGDLVRAVRSQINDSLDETYVCETEPSGSGQCPLRLSTPLHESPAQEAIRRQCRSTHACLDLRQAHDCLCPPFFRCNTFLSMRSKLPLGNPRPHVESKPGIRRTDEDEQLSQVHGGFLDRIDALIGSGIAFPPTNVFVRNPNLSIPTICCTQFVANVV